MKLIIISFEQNQLKLNLNKSNCFHQKKKKKTHIKLTDYTKSTIAWLSF